MDTNQFLIELQAKLDEAKSVKNINTDLDTIEKAIEKLKVQAEIDPNSVKNIAQQLSNILNQKIVVNNIQIEPNNAIKDGQQVGQKIGGAVNQGISSSLKNIKAEIANAIKSISSLDSNKIINEMNLNRASVGTDTVNQVRLLVSEINNLGREVVKTGSDDSWEKLITKGTELGKILDTFGKTRNFQGMEDVKKFTDYFNGKTISVGYKNSGLSGTDFTTSQLNKELKELGVRFNSTKQNAIELDTIWEEMCHSTGRMDLLNITTAQDQIQTVISELQKAQSVLNGEKGLINYPNARSVVSEYLNNIEETRKVVVSFENELSSLAQKELQNSTSATDTIIQNEERKQQAIQDTAKIQEQLSKNGNIIQQTDFATSFNTKDEAEKYFNILSKTVSVQEKLGENKNLASFIVDVKNAEGVVEKLTYKYNKLKDTFEYSGGSINSNGVIKQMDTISAKADSLQIRLDKLKANAAGFEQMTQIIHELDIAIEGVGDKSSLDKFINNLRVAESQLGRVKAESANNLQVEQTIIRLNNQLQKNSNYSKAAKDKIREWLSELENGNVASGRLKQINVEAKELHSNMVAINKSGQALFDKIGSKINSLGTYLSAAAIISKVLSSTKNGIVVIKELDTALVDLKKTTNATAQELENFYYSANDTAKQLGITTKSIISATSAWSRLGYSIKEAQIMAENSAILTSISPDIDSIDKSTDALVSVLKAYSIDAQDSLDSVISKINIIGNTQAVSNGDIVDILTRSSSAMAAANNSLEQTIALGTAATEITRNSAEVGTALKTISMRIRGYDEETESYSEDLENLAGTIADLTKTASSPGGISLFTDKTKETYKSTYQILSDIRDIWDELSDKNQAELLEALAGKRQGQIVSALISNWDAAESSMKSMTNSAGNAMKEMEVIYDSLDYKLNITAETATGIAQNLFKKEDMKSVVDVSNSFMGILDKVTEKLGLFGTIGLGAGLFAGVKNTGKCRISVRIS